MAGRPGVAPGVKHGTCVPKAEPRPLGVEEKPGARLSVTLVVGDEQCEPAWVNDHADVAREEFDADAQERTTRRQHARAKLTLGERWDTAVRGLEALSTVGASPVGRSSKTTGDDERDPGPPKAERPNIDAHVTVVTRHVEDVERELDAERGHVRPRSGGLESGDEKDKRLVDEFSGVQSSIVARDNPDFGSTRTVENARRREAMRRHCKINAKTGVLGAKVTIDPRDADWPGT
jgi:hypothetical protein